ncbi:lytic transglycosylase domain-containing protein [Persephonella sp.]
MIVLVFLVFFSFSYAFEECVEKFKQERYLSADRCFSRIDSEDPVYPYAVYYRVLIGTITDNLRDDLESELIRLKNYAVSHYGYLVLARYYLKENKEKASKYIKIVDTKAILKEDIPYYLYLKSRIYSITGNEKRSFLIKRKLATKYTFDRYYGFKTLMDIKDRLGEKDIYEAVDTLSSYRMFKRALKVLPLVSYSQKYLYYKTVLNVKMRRYKEAERYFYMIDRNSKWFPRAVYSMVIFNYRDYEKQKTFFKMLLKTSNRNLITRAAHKLMKKSFYRRAYKDFEYFASFIKRDFRYYSDKIWFSFLKEYRKGRYKKAAKILEKNIDKFSDKAKIYYWLYLTYSNIDKKKAENYLIKASSLNSNSFYSLWAKRKVGVRKVSIRITSLPDLELDRQLKLIEKLKKKGFYKESYMEALFYKRKKGDLLKLYKVFPEITARKFSLSKDFYTLSYPKPFSDIERENLVYSIMRQESFFDAFAVSRSNAVGLMQIIPPTAKWIAKKLGEKDFDITDLFDPHTNIRFGKWYIKYLIKKFNGNLFHAIASYNGGEVIVKKVLKNNKFRDVVEFIEYIPYNETRNYVKKVYRNLIIYNYRYPVERQ